MESETTVDSKNTERRQALKQLISGLRKPHKEISFTWLYDERGSQIFDEITELEEYYPFRVETGILHDSIEAIKHAVPPECILLELGSGSSVKTTYLLEQTGVKDYFPIDISEKHLLKTSAELEKTHPGLHIHPISADYFAHFPLPPWTAGRPKTVIFLGSSIGNLLREEQLRLLGNIRGLIGVHGGFLVGIDMKKDPQVLHAAYNDAAGVTAAFNLNTLSHLNQTLGTDFRPEYFRHYAPYNPVLGRIEMYLISRVDQRVHVGGEGIDIREGESIMTEFSCKFTVDQFTRLVADAGLRVAHLWQDPQRWFSLFFLVQ